MAKAISEDGVTRRQVTAAIAATAVLAPTPASSGTSADPHVALLARLNDLDNQLTIAAEDTAEFNRVGALYSQALREFIDTPAAGPEGARIKLKFLAETPDFYSEDVQALASDVLRVLESQS